MESLILWDIFDEVEIAFLPVGYTHSDLYQAFSSSSERLRHHDAVTLQDLHNMLGEYYKEHPKVSTLKNLANCSGLCDQT